MQYRIFVTVTEASKLLSLGKTSIFARIKDGSLQTAKMGRSTRITLSSLIDYALRCLKEGNGSGDLAEIFGDREDIKARMIADHFAAQLCNIPQTGIEFQSHRQVSRNSAEVEGLKSDCSAKKLAGEF